MAGETITFLYKFVQGECPMSFGLNVARMAGIKLSVLERAKKRAALFKQNLCGKVTEKEENTEPQEMTHC